MSYSSGSSGRVMGGGGARNMKFSGHLFYRLQTKFAKVMFLQVSVCPGGGGIPACIAGGIPACLAAGGGISACIAGGIPACLAAGGGIPACIAGGIPACLAAGGVGQQGGWVHTQGKLRGLTRGGSMPTPGGVQAHTRGCISQHALRQTPPSPVWTATAAGGTHPTGMHSCYDLFS